MSAVDIGHNTLSSSPPDASEPRSFGTILLWLVAVALAIVFLAAAFLLAPRANTRGAAGPTVPGRVELIGHTDLVQAIDVSADGRRIATAGNHGDMTVRIWDAVSGIELVTIHLPRPAPAQIEDVAFSADGGAVAARIGDGVSTSTSFWDGADGSRADPFATPWDAVGKDVEQYDVVVSPVGTTAVRLERHTGATLIDPATEATIHQLGSKNTAYSAAFRSDGAVVAVMFDEFVRVWRLDPFEELSQIRIPSYEATASHMTFTPDGSRIAFTVEDRVVVAPVEDD